MAKAEAKLVSAIPERTAKIVDPHMNELSPGLRFTTYFGGYDANAGWAVDRESKGQMFRKACALSPDVAALSKALFTRQQALWPDGPSFLTLRATTTSPLATGLGIEHPLENGFSFLKPYGLPYLPGSGIKGVLRAAAVEMGEDEGWSEETIERLFGAAPKKGEDAENEKESSFRGELSFFDAYPQMNEKSLTVEIMNPHHGAYYSGEASPSGTRAPVPVFFLAIAPKTEFLFHVSRLVRSEASSLQGEEEWKELLVRTFEHAFRYLGFGAKTAVGYGAFESDDLAKRSRMLEEKKAQAESARLLASGTLPPGHELWEGATLQLSPGDGRIKIIDAKTGQKADLDKPSAEGLQATLSPEEQARFKKKKEMKLSLVMRKNGSLWEFVQVKR